MANKCASKLKNKVTGEIYDVKDAAARADIETLGDDLENKVDKSKVASTVYATNANGEQTHLKFATAANPDTVVVRTPTGHIMSMSPTSDNHAATKKYVDQKAGLTIEDVTSDNGVKVLSDYKYFIVTAVCGYYGEFHCASWTVSRKLLEAIPEGDAAYFAPFEFTTTDSNGDTLLHTLSLSVDIVYENDLYFNINCECTGMSTDGQFTYYIEGVK